MNYKPLTCVWEVTMGCNMRCQHCGSSCENALPGELTTEEAYKFIDMCADMGLLWVTISGGEPLIRKDLPLLVKRFTDRGIKANIITNGWALTNDIASKLKNADVSTVAISLDGTQEIHDSIRRNGSFQRSKRSFEILKSYGIATGCVTTITNKNIDCLNKMKEYLLDMGVDLWQLQIGLPMGNMSKHADWVISPDRVRELIDFCYDNLLEGKIYVYPADCIGYYSKKEMEVLNKINGETNYVWDGCNAGKRSFGLLHNGDVLGCTSIRDREFIEGNIREKTLREIWESKDSFKWNREMKKSKLKGDCRICKYADMCLGGCANTRISMNSSIYSENIYCSHNVLMKKFREKLSKINDLYVLKTHAKKMVSTGSFQEASLTLERASELSPKDVEISNLKLHSDRQCGNI